MRRSRILPASRKRNVPGGKVGAESLPVAPSSVFSAVVSCSFFLPFFQILFLLLFFNSLVVQQQQYTLSLSIIFIHPGDSSPSQCSS